MSADGVVSSVGPDRRARVRRLGALLMVLGALAVLAVLVGRVAALVVGPVLPADASLTWTGQRWYVVGAGGRDALCALTAPDGSRRSLVLGLPTRQQTERSLSASSSFVTPGGSYVDAEPGGRGTLRCTDDVRVTSGTTTLVYGPAEAGLWLAGPGLAALVLGAALRRRRPG